MANKDREAANEGLNQLFSANNDILGNIISSDRKRTGRNAEAETPESPEIVNYDNVTIVQSDNETSNKALTHYNNKTLLQEDNETIRHYDNTTKKQDDSNTSHKRKAAKTQKPPPSKSENELLTKRISEAKRMAESSTTTVTLRIPRELNDWLDEYVHRAWPERIKKQELVVEALRLVIARRGKAGEPILESELFPEDN